MTSGERGFDDERNGRRTYGGESELARRYFGKQLTPSRTIRRMPMANFTLTPDSSPHCSVKSGMNIYFVKRNYALHHHLLNTSNGCDAPDAHSSFASTAPDDCIALPSGRNRGLRVETMYDCRLAFGARNFNCSCEFSRVSSWKTN